MCSRLAVAAALAGPAGARSRRPPSRRFALLAGALLLTAGALRATEIPWSDAFALYDEYPGVFTVAAADIDRDGISDLVAAAPETNALAWFRHLGNGVFVAKVIAFPVASIHDAQVADLDRDGDPDIVVTSGDDSDAVGWFENDGTPLDGGWTLHYIATGFDEGGRLAIADFDRDGDLDVAAASAIEEGGTVAVALNADGLGTSWTFEIVDAAFDAALRALAGDIDGDGDADLAGVAFGDDGIGGFAWWSRGAGVWARHVVAWPVPAARALALCDVDRDGDLDLIGSACATAIDEVLWWENPTWAIHGVASDLGAWNLEAADLDRDGDCDLLYGALADDWAGWVENADGAGGSWTPRPMPEVVDHVFGITADDFDRDGDLDFVAAAGGPDDLLAWGNLTLHRNARFPVEKSTGLGGATRRWPPATWTATAIPTCWAAPSTSPTSSGGRTSARRRTGPSTRSRPTSPRARWRSPTSTAAASPTPSRSVRAASITGTTCPEAAGPSTRSPPRSARRSRWRPATSTATATSTWSAPSRSAA